MLEKQISNYFLVKWDACSGMTYVESSFWFQKCCVCFSISWFLMCFFCWMDYFVRTISQIWNYINIPYIDTNESTNGPCISDFRSDQNSKKSCFFVRNWSLVRFFCKCNLFHRFLCMKWMFWLFLFLRIIKNRYYLKIIFRDFLSLNLYFLIFKSALS